MLPLLVMPVVIPLMVGSVELTRQALGTGDGTSMWQWLGILAGFRPDGGSRISGPVQLRN